MKLPVLYVEPGQYWDGWLSSGKYTTSVCNQAKEVNSALAFLQGS